MGLGHKSIAKNAIYQTVYNILATITPLITTPIISREVGAEGLGVFSYTLTISHYFTIFSMLGIVNYGTRSIAENNSSKEQVSKTFWSIYSVQFCMSIICNLLYVGYIYLWGGEKYIFFLIQSFWVLGTLFDISWLFFGLEEFKTLVIRNTIIKVLSVLSIVLFVRRDNNPLVIYTIIVAGSNFLSIISVVPLLAKKIVFVKTSFKEIKKHIKPICILFVPILAGVLFGSMDKVMLGGKDEYSELGYYYNADRMINIPITVINGLSTVLFPRISSMLSNGKVKESFGFIEKSFEVVVWTAFLLGIGVAGCAEEFVPLFFGPGYDRTVGLVYIMIPILVISSISGFYRMQYLVPFHFDTLYAVALFIGAGFNLVLNFFLIPKYHAGGAAIATLFAQLLVMIVQFMRHEGINIKHWIKLLVTYALIGALMYGIMWTIKLIPLYNNIVRLIVEIIVGGVSYIAISIGYWKITNQLKEKIQLIKR